MGLRETTRSIVAAIDVFIVRFGPVVLGMGGLVVVYADMFGWYHPTHAESMILLAFVSGVLGMTAIHFDWFRGQVPEEYRDY